MESIEFTKTTVAEAKAVVDEGGDAAQANAERPPETDWVVKRKQPQDTKLSNSAVAWLTQLPREVRPLQLSVRFSRIANKLAEIWPRTDVCERYLGELLIVEREGKRQGFPLKVLVELTNLKDYKNQEVTKGKS